MITKEEIEKKLREHFPDSEIKLQDMTGGQDHWYLEIRSVLFQQKNIVEQHQLVYKALGTWMKKEIHALSLKTESVM